MTLFAVSEEHKDKESVIITTADIDEFSLRRARTTARNSARNTEKKSGILIANDQFRAGEKMPIPDFSSHCEASVAMTVLINSINGLVIGRLIYYKKGVLRCLGRCHHI